MDKVAGTKNGFDRKIEDVTAGFEGPLAIVIAKGRHLKPPLTNDFKILVPVSGSGVSRRGADLVVMGVDRIHGEALNFGSVAAAVLRKSKVSVLLVSNGEANQKG
jgi:hypothetical protein